MRWYGSGMRLLLVEDDQVMRTTLERALTRRGMQVSAVGDGIEALSAWTSRPPHVMVLDLSLPGMDGLQVLKEGRQRGLQTPVLLLTARGTVGDRIVGLNSGADDYLPKPFDLDELEARLRALLRRSSDSFAPKPPPDRVSLTLPTLNGARAILLLTEGAGKAQPLAAALGEPTRHVPSSLLDRGRLTVVADADALP